MGISLAAPGKSLAHMVVTGPDSESSAPVRIYEEGGEIGTQFGIFSSGFRRDMV
jgi:hypothetical protein